MCAGAPSRAEASKLAQVGDARLGFRRANDESRRGHFYHSSSLGLPTPSPSAPERPRPKGARSSITTNGVESGSGMPVALSEREGNRPPDSNTRYRTMYREAILFTPFPRYLVWIFPLS